MFVSYLSLPENLRIQTKLFTEKICQYFQVIFIDRIDFIVKSVQWRITYTDIITDEPLWDDCTNHSKLLIVAQIFTIKLDYGLIEASYEKIIEWARNILLEGNVLKDNFHAAKSKMKPLV